MAANPVVLRGIEVISARPLASSKLEAIHPHAWAETRGSPRPPIPPALAHTDTAGNERVTLLTHLLLFSSVGSSQISAAAARHNAPLLSPAQQEREPIFFFFEKKIKK